MLLPQDQYKLIISLIGVAICSYGFTYLKKKYVILSFSIISTLILQMYVFGYQCILLWIQQHIVYILCKLAPRKKIGPIILIESFIFLGGIMIKNLILSYGEYKVDITAIMMMQVFLYIGIAYNYQDGLPENSIIINQRKLIQFPNYFYYLGYVCFLPASLVGPVFQYQDWYNFIHRKQNYQNIPNTIPAILKQAKTLIFCIICYSLNFLCPFEYILSQQYASLNCFYQFIYLTITIFGQRCKYYGVWSLGMIAMHASGITYNPQQKQNKWDRITVSDIYTFELDPSLKKKSQAWNQSIQLALRRYIYQRAIRYPLNITQKIKKKIQIKAQLKTFFISAIWHGFYPGYFVSFFHWFLTLQISQQLYRLSRHNQKIKKLKQKLWILELLFINFYVGYFGTSFLLMSWNNINKFFNATYYIPVVILYILNILIVRMKIIKFKKVNNQDISQSSPQKQIFKNKQLKKLD